MESLTELRVRYAETDAMGIVHPILNYGMYHTLCVCD